MKIAKICDKRPRYEDFFAKSQELGLGEKGQGVVTLTNIL